MGERGAGERERERQEKERKRGRKREAKGEMLGRRRAGGRGGTEEREKQEGDKREGLTQHTDKFLLLSVTYPSMANSTMHKTRPHRHNTPKPFSLSLPVFPM